MTSVLTTEVAKLRIRNSVPRTGGWDSRLTTTSHHWSPVFTWVTSVHPRSQPPKDRTPGDLPGGHCISGTGMERTAQGPLGRDAHVRRGGEVVRLTSCGSSGVFGLRDESRGARRVLPPGRAQRWSARRLSLGTDDQVDSARRLRSAHRRCATGRPRRSRRPSRRLRVELQRPPRTPRHSDHRQRRCVTHQ